MLDVKVDYLNQQLSGATGAHSEAMRDVDAYRAYYQGYVDLDVYDGSSTAVLKDVMRTVEGSIPSLVDPFLGKDIASVESQNAVSEEGAKAHVKVINYQWNKQNNPLETSEVIARNLQIDGTVWTKVGWNKKGFSTIDVVPFEAVIPDPSAYTIDDMKYVIYRRKVSVSEILSNPVWFGKHTLSSLQPLMQSSDTQYEAPNDIGRDDMYDQGQRALNELEIFEYYGEYDVKGKGVTTPVVAIWSQNMLLNAFDSPYPEFSIPFDNTVYIRKPYSIYGIGVGGLIGDKQTQRSGLMRGVFDNMARSNNGTKFIKKGALDTTNYNRLMRHDPVVEINNGANAPLGNVIWDGNFNQLPADVYKMLADIETDEENLTGITKYAVGTDSRSLNQTATGISIISSMSQRRLLFIAQHISGLLTRVFKKWMLLNRSLLDNPILDGEYDLYVTAGTAGLQAKKSQDIIGMIQALSGLQGTIDPSITTQLIADLAESMDLDTTARSIRDNIDRQKEQPQQPDPMQQAAIQLEFEKKQAEIAKDHSIANKNNAAAQENYVDAAMKTYQG